MLFVFFFVSVLINNNNNLDIFFLPLKQIKTVNNKYGFFSDGCHFVINRVFKTKEENGI